MPVRSRRNVGQTVGAATAQAVVVPTDRVAIIRRLDLDVEVAGAAGTLRVSLLSGGTSVELYAQAAPPVGMVFLPDMHDLILQEGDQLRVLVPATYTISWWASYVLLAGDPA